LINKGLRGLKGCQNDCRGSVDHGAGLGLFGEALQAEIRLDKNPMVSSGKFVCGFVVVGEMALG
jgi:hypothetical protein